MRLSKKELMDDLGVGYELGPYETHPWSHYDTDTGTTCSAEARMDPDGIELEAEIQMMYETPPAGTPPMEQLFWIKANFMGTTGEWEVNDMKLRGEHLGDDVSGWQEKGCRFFNAIVQDLQAEIMPDIEEYIDTILLRKDRLGDQRQGGGGKSPKINTTQLSGMKKGGF